MSNVFLKCDDHLNRFNQIIQATRYCSECNKACCDTCVIDFHIEHIIHAKTRIDEYLVNVKSTLDNLKFLINNSITSKINIQDIYKTINVYEKKFESYFTIRKTYLENLKNKIDKIIKNEDKLCKNIMDKISNFYKDEYSKSMDAPLKKNQKLLIDIQNFLNEWDNFSKSEKMNIFKNNKIEEFQNEYSKINEIIQKSNENFEEKTKFIEMRINEILKDLNINDKLNEFDKIINDIEKSNTESIEKLNSTNEISQSNIEKDYKLLIYIKIHSNILIVFNPNLEMRYLKITKNNFENPSESFINFPDNSKYVNLGNSIVLTGGFINRNLINSCYLIVINKNENNEEYDIKIKSFGKMKNARERHNIIYLPDKKIVLVCSGFYNKGSEYTEIDKIEWKNIGEMNEERGNATIAYINKRYIFVIGGFKVVDNKKSKNNGFYHGNYEYLDFLNLNNGWIQREFNNISIQISVMGVIHINNNQLIVCGGFDGKQKNIVYKIDCSDVNYINVEKMNITLPENCIFIHNNFIQIENDFYNLELNGYCVKFSPENMEFSINKDKLLNRKSVSYK